MYGFAMRIAIYCADSTHRENRQPISPMRPTGCSAPPSAPADMEKSDIIEYLNSPLAAQLFETMGITTETKRTFLPSLIE